MAPHQIIEVLCEVGLHCDHFDPSGSQSFDKQRSVPLAVAAIIVVNSDCYAFDAAQRWKLGNAGSIRTMQA
jgi:hypothetical protein